MRKLPHNPSKPTQHPVLLCKLFGHKYTEKDLIEWGIPYNTFTITRYPYCLRCGVKHD